ncbi:MAG: DNA primase [Solirubrobacteraceae bacterium]
MTRYTADSRDRVMDAVDMVALVSARTELRRAGVDSYFGLCPFHDERSASFHVRPDEKHYWCFGCQATGDPFTFVMETEGLDFKAAMESLADRFGVALETEDEDPEAAAKRQRRERLLTVLDRAATYYARYLWEAAEAQAARDYLRDRGLEERTLKEFRVGYAPSAWDRILMASRRAGYSDDELVAVGLVQRSHSRPGQVYDRFRGRITFPAVDARGRVRGFGARRLGADGGAGTGSATPGAKYLNTSDGELYHKREVLFGIDLARAAGSRAGRMILVEGYTDVLALHQAGIRNTVGIMGTSLTEEQIAELERVVTVLELCLDSDQAGQEAMLRAARVAAGHRLELRVVVMPEGTDPAELVERDGAQALRERVEGSVAFAVFRVDRILAQADTGSAEGRDRALTELRPVLQELSAGVLRDELVRKVSGRLELTEARLATVLASAAAARRPDDPGRAAANGRDGGSGGAGGAGGAGGGVANGAGLAGSGQGLRHEQLFLALCVAMPELGATVLEQIDIDRLLNAESMRKAARHLRGRTRTPLAELPPQDEALAGTVADLVALAGRVPDPSPDRLEHARLLLDCERLDRAILRARADGSGGTELAAEREAVRAALHAANARLEQTL